MPPSHVARPLAAVLLASLLSCACAPRIYQRSTVTLEAPDDEGTQIRYGEFDGCLLRQQLPVEYVVRRRFYTLTIRPIAALEDDRPRVEVRVSGDATVMLRVVGAEPPVEARYAEGGSRYVIDTGAIAGTTLEMELSRAGEVIGQERFDLKKHSCRVLSPGD